MARKDLNGEMRLFFFFFLDTPVLCGILDFQDGNCSLHRKGRVLATGLPGKVSREMRCEQRPI